MFIRLQQSFSSKDSRSFKLDLYRNWKCSSFCQNCPSSGQHAGVTVKKKKGRAHIDPRQCWIGTETSRLILSVLKSFSVWQIRTNAYEHTLLANHRPGTLHVLTLTILTNLNKHVTVIRPILQMRQGRSRGVTCSSLHSREGRNQDLNSYIWPQSLCP